MKKFFFFFLPLIVIICIVFWYFFVLSVMFLPFGFLLPLIVKKCRCWWVTYLAGCIFSTLIELFQVLTKRGIFDLDDIFNNTVGAMIGYGLVSIVFGLYCKKRCSIIFFQIPLFSILIAFSAIFIGYQQKELGNLDIAYNYRQNMSKISITSDRTYSDKSDMAEVYKADIANKEETLKVANNFFAVNGTCVDESQNNVYDDVIVYKSADGNEAIWVYYIGLTTWFSDFPNGSSSGQSGLSFSEVISVLNAYQIEIPEQADFTELDDGEYQITVKMADMGEYYLDGTLTCTIVDNQLSNMQNNIVKYLPYKKFPIISEQTAYQRITEGKFNAYLADADGIEYVVNKVTLSYAMDSKGYYQPVYEFDEKESDEADMEGSIRIPAIE